MIGVLAREAGAWGWLWPLWIVAVWVGLFFLFGFLFRRRGRGWHDHHAIQSAEGVLGERYARGEITEEEYQKRLDVLRRSR
jgi:putative membrane protein